MSEMINLYEPYQGFIRGNMYKNIYNDYSKIYDIKPMNEQAELLTYIDMFDFACIDLSLYLDVYPEDQQMIELYNQIKEEKVKVTSKYEEKYGALSLNSKNLNKVPWEWNNSPWPWEV